VAADVHDLPVRAAALGVKIGRQECAVGRALQMQVEDLPPPKPVGSQHGLDSCGHQMAGVTGSMLSQPHSLTGGMGLASAHPMVELLKQPSRPTH
jgi:hypothetical protein